MKSPKLNFCFHNPNTENKTADYIVKLIIEANLQKVEEAILHTPSKAHTTSEEQRAYINE